MTEDHDAAEKKRRDAEIERAIEALLALRKESRLDGVSWKVLRDAGRR
ncbi:MAG: hypothetical protein OXI39_12115 [Gemmatimonadota bacterium]|nr:hypothetical protein [Candidatus Palauibacter scopulicola]MDE2663732.1 hypothetical protein [Candidatus Palauibacter scopulicola]